MHDAPKIGDNSKERGEWSSSRQERFDVVISTQKLKREQEAKCASEHGVPTAHDILRSADLSLQTSYIPETTSPISHLNSNDLGFSAQKIIGEEVSGLHQRFPLTATLRQRINEAVEASQQEPRSTDRPLRGDTTSD